MKNLFFLLVTASLLSACGAPATPAAATRPSATSVPAPATAPRQSPTAPKTAVSGAALSVQNQKSVTTAEGNRATGEIVTDEKLSVGQMDVASPEKMLLGESRPVVLRMTPSGQILSLKTGPAGGVKPVDLPDVVFKYSNRIDIYPVMLAELRGVNFEIDPKGPQRRDFKGDASLAWTWVISPRVASTQALSLEISIPAIISGNRSELTILQAIPLSVQVDAPTPTPVPFGDQIARSIADNAGAIVVALIGLFGTILGLVMKARSDAQKK